MLRTDLIDILNSGTAWAFVGSGASANAGCPTWKELVVGVISQFDDPTRVRIQNDDLYELAFSDNNFATCFSRIEWCVGRKKLENAVIEIIGRTTTPGDVTKRLADLPFSGYTTTNYDNLLELALQTQPGWSAVGNLQDEIRKMSGGVTRVVWHIHGSTSMRDKSRLILTEKDYDDLYLEDTPSIQQLRGLLTQHRMVFVGFGFNDPEITRSLKRIGRLCSPARPIYAFLSGVAGAQYDAIRKEFLQKYNVDIIPYRVVDGRHNQLVNLLDVYGALILRRSLTFGQPARECPSYDPQTTGLLIYNEFALREGTHVRADILDALLKARILSLLKYRVTCTVDDLMADLEARASVLQSLPTSSAVVAKEIESVLSDLKAQDLVTLGDDPEKILRLTPKGSDFVDDQSATAERLSDQFVASLQTRATALIDKNLAAATRVAKAAELFLKDCIEHRALGVAMARHARTSDYQSYHMVALLQTLPKYMEQLLTQEEAIALSKLVQGILSAPSEAESGFIGLALQAQFGVHLLGYDPDALRARTRDFSNTLFLFDSSTLIPYLARSSVGHSSASLLIERLRSINSKLATTTLLAYEVSEHAQWAIGRMQGDLAHLNSDSLQAATGRAGDRSNAFIEGYLSEKGAGTVGDFLDYLRQVCGLPLGAGAVQDTRIQQLLNQEEIFCLGFSEWEGFTDELWVERDELNEKIADLREANRTFRHWRQVKAEAEALIIIRNLRDGIFTIAGETPTNAFFISHTRIIDQVANIGVPVTMRPEAALQWVAALTACTLKELSFLTNGLLLELAERNLNIVDRPQLETTFYPLLNASRAKLDEVINTHRVLISQRFGEDAEKAFTELDPLEVPFVLENYNLQRVEELETQLKLEQEQRAAAQTIAKMSEKERADYERLRVAEMRQKQRSRSRKRAAVSKVNKKKGKKARKK